MANELQEFIADMRSDLDGPWADDPNVEGKIVLKYGDYILRQGGLDSLADGNYVSDDVTCFYIKYLGDEVYPEKSTKVKIVRSEMVDMLQMIRLTQAKLENLMGGNVQDYNFILFPLNKSKEDIAALVSGENPHWSLLVYCRIENVIAHFDSSYGTNYTPAERFARQLSKSIPSAPMFSSRGCNAQNTPEDSALHILSNIEKIVSHVLKYKLINGVQTAKPDYATGLREKITSLIQTKAKASSEPPVTSS